MKYIRLGELSPNQSDTVSKQFNVIERIIHPEYQNSTRYYDIALLKIDGSVSFDEYTRPICIQIMTAFDGDAFAVRWERNQSEKARLFAGALEMISGNDCNVSPEHFPDGIDDEMQICAGIQIKRENSCQVIEV